MTRDFEGSLAVRRNLHNSTPAGKRSRHVQVARRVKSQALRASQTAEKSVNRALRIDSMHAVKTRCRRPCHKQVALRPESKVVRRDARLQSGEDEYLLVAANLENGAAAVAHVEILTLIKSNPRGDPHALSIRRHVSIRRHAINRAILA